MSKANDVVIPVNRWLQLVAGVNLHGDDRQLSTDGPTSSIRSARSSTGAARKFRSPSDLRRHETWLVPVEGWFVDRFGRGSSHVRRRRRRHRLDAHAFATSLPALYFAEMLAVWAPAPSTAPASATRSSGSPIAASRRGLTAAGFARERRRPSTDQLHHHDVRLRQGVSLVRYRQGVVILVLSQFLKGPSRVKRQGARKLSQSARDFKPMEMLKTPAFWILYVMLCSSRRAGSSSPRRSRRSRATTDRRAAGEFPVHQFDRLIMAA